MKPGRIHLPRSFVALIHDLYSLSVEVSFSSSLKNSLISSSHLLLGLPNALYVLYLEMSSGFHSAALTIHLSVGRDAILSAILHFCLLCVLIQHRIFASSILSMTSPVLLFMYSIQSSPSISVVSISSSVSLLKDMSLSLIVVCVLSFVHLRFHLQVLLKYSASSFFFGLIFFFSRAFCISFSFV